MEKRNNTANHNKTGKKSLFAKFEYVEKIVQKEEENRIRNASILR